MKTRSLLIVGICLSNFPGGLADVYDPLALTYSYARNIAQDVRTSWRQFHDRHTRGQRHVLTKRASSSPGKCQLRLAADFNSTSPSDSHHHPSSSSSSSLLSSTSRSFSSASTRGSSSTTANSASPTTSNSAGMKTTSTSSAAPTYPTSIFTLKQVHNGSSFFDGWDFFSAGDPTQGIVNYLDAGDAWGQGLVSINGAGHAVMKVDTTPVVSGNRNSVRINFSNSFNGGLLTADIYHMPAGCGTWPAWWTNGPDWPTYGEIDILEGVHLPVQNQVSLHTAPGCQIASTTGFSGNVVNGGSCGSTSGSNTGCGILSYDTASIGVPFNDGGGGVYAMLWDTSGIRVWLFHRGNIPADLVRDQPLPETWGQPMALIPAAQCNPYQYMQNHVAILDTTLCGTWAGSAGSWAGGCQQSTGSATCEDYVRNQGGAFANAYWEIASVKLYQ